MKKITKEECVVVRKEVPEAHIAIVNRKSSHKKYYVEESRMVEWVLARLSAEKNAAAAQVKKQ